MNKAALYVFGILLLGPFGLRAADRPSEAPRGHKIDMLVVAERSKHGAELAKTQGDTPPTYVLYDGGYVEAGDPIAGDKPASADAVAAALQHSLQEAGFQSVPAGTTPTFILIYHWGSLRPRVGRDIGLSRIDPNLKARLSLVAPMKTVDSLEDEILTRRGSPISASNYVDRPNWRDALDFARDARYFVVVTAYEGSEVKSESAVPVWRVNLSAQETSTTMAKAVPALAASAGPFLGKDLDRPQYSTALLNLSDASTTPNKEEAGTMTAAAAPPSDSVLQQLIKKEHDRVAGEFVPEVEKDVW